MRLAAEMVLCSHSGPPAPQLSPPRDVRSRSTQASPGPSPLTPLPPAIAFLDPAVIPLLTAFACELQRRFELDPLVLQQYGAQQRRLRQQSTEEPAAASSTTRLELDPLRHYPIGDHRAGDKFRPTAERPVGPQWTSRSDHAAVWSPNCSPYSQRGRRLQRVRGDGLPPTLQQDLDIKMEDVDNDPTSPLADGTRPRHLRRLRPLRPQQPVSAQLSRSLFPMPPSQS